MNLPKVYLAKSNRANPELVSRVRQTLSTLNVEIVEYTGGKYSHKEMLECEQLVIIPDLSNKDDDDIIIGKGLYEQIEEFGCQKGLDYVFVIAKENMSVKEVYSMDIINSENYIEYGVIEFTYESNNIDEFLGDILLEIYGCKDTNTTISPVNSNWYCLIGRKK